MIHSVAPVPETHPRAKAARVPAPRPAEVRSGTRSPEMLVALQRRAGNRAVSTLLTPQASGDAKSVIVQRCAGCGCGGACTGMSRAGGEATEEEPVQRAVSPTAGQVAVQRRPDPNFGEALDAGRFPGATPAPLLDVVMIFDRLSPADKRDTLRSLNPSQQLAWVRFCLNRPDDATWHAIIETVATSVRTYAVRALMSANRLNEPRGPWGAYGVLNGLSDTDQLSVLNQLVEPERRRLQQNLASAPIDRLRLERQLAAVDPDTVPAVRQITFPLTWIADELPPRALAAAGPAAYMGSQGAHAVGATPGASGMRLIGTDYWRALIPARRAVELQRVLNQLPRDLSTHFQTHMANTPPGQAPQFPWVSRPPGAMTRPFTIAELQSIPALVAKFNADSRSLTASEATLLTRVASLHVGGAHTGGSPLSSWSVPPARGQPDPVTWAGDRRFRVRADFQRSAVLDNVNASAANTLSAADAAKFEAPLNPQEAEYLATAESHARVLTVEPMGAVKGELVPGSAAWMARNARTLRWAGRGLIVVSFVVSGARIATAEEAQRSRVIGEEVGGQLFGIGGAVLAGAACVGFGIATGGVGLVLCGMAGGLLGGMAGSALGGAAGASLDRPVAANDPFNLTGGGTAWIVSSAPVEILNY